MWRLSPCPASGVGTNESRGFAPNGMIGVELRIGKLCTRVFRIFPSSSKSPIRNQSKNPTVSAQKATTAICVEPGRERTKTLFIFRAPGQAGSNLDALLNYPGSTEVIEHLRP